MIKTIKFLGIAVLACFSFYYTEKSLAILKEKDPIMIKIKQVAEAQKTIPVNATIQNDFIVPGTSGLEVDVEKSYNSMKRYGVYSQLKLVYKEILPTVTISNNYHKYIISGNKTKKIVSLIFRVNDVKYLDQIVQILDKNSTIGNFFINDSVFDDNQSVISGISEKHYINIVNSNLNNITKNNKNRNLLSNKLNYCVTDIENKKLLSACAKNKMKTIIPSILVNKYPFSDVKQNLTSGSIISFNFNQSTVDELEIVIKFIKSKGYYIENLDKLLHE